jgi:hypothetical protein
MKYLDTLQYPDDVPSVNRPQFQNLLGQKFGKLTAIGTKRMPNKKLDWLCKCDCGEYAIIPGIRLTTGTTKSCGCQHYPGVRRTHGMCGTAEYGAFTSAKERCNNPKNRRYDIYGGRGIEFRFDSFEQFFAEVGLKPSPHHSLDRKDSNGHYEPGNVRWATDHEQRWNKRWNVRLTLNGTTKPAIEWAKILGVPKGTIYSRHKAGKCDACCLAKLPPNRRVRCYHLNPTR